MNRDLTTIARTEFPALLTLSMQQGVEGLERLM